MAKPLPLVAYPDLEDQVKALENDGFVYFPNVINAEEIAELRAAMDGLEPRKGIDGYSTPETGGKFFSKHVNNAFNRDIVVLQYLDKPGVIDVVEGAQGSDCHIIQMTAWMVGPGRPNQNLHVDWLPISLPEDIMADARVKVPIFITTAHFYLNDIHEDLAPTEIVPGSHRSGRSPGGDTQWGGVKSQSILCNAGDVILFRSEVWHRGTANKSNETRYLLQVHYAHRWIAQRFTPFLTFQFDANILAQATPRQRRLLGEHRPGPYA